MGIFEIVIVNLACYAISYVAVTDYGYKGDLLERPPLSLLLRPFEWASDVIEERELRLLLFFPIAIPLVCISLLIFLAAMILGGTGFQMGFSKGKSVRLRATGEEFLGQKEKLAEEFKTEILPEAEHDPAFQGVKREELQERYVRWYLEEGKNQDLPEGSYLHFKYAVRKHPWG